ncbi:hypothetical protein [Arthrobacter cupressi]|uniref:hypothetical protein n=1 Tax=Arthrobacter cupressi TaxID=1045773 RepID=UPI00183D869F|nr:hypothetical protein [Arthrobacter cupressi]NYD78520.1 hypothetical protein [Arthrobacter cupressi]
MLVLTILPLPTAFPFPAASVPAAPRHQKGRNVRQSSHTSLWKSLEQGDLVILSQGGVPCHRGSIDDRTEDGQLIWVTDDIGHRRLFHIDDDYELMIYRDTFSR